MYIYYSWSPGATPKETHTDHCASQACVQFKSVLFSVCQAIAFCILHQFNIHPGDPPHKPQVQLV
jgi:hypothetical protein